MTAGAAAGRQSVPVGFYLPQEEAWRIVQALHLDELNNETIH